MRTDIFCNLDQYILQLKKYTFGNRKLDGQLLPTTGSKMLVDTLSRFSILCTAFQEKPPQKFNLGKLVIGAISLLIGAFSSNCKLHIEY